MTEAPDSVTVAPHVLINTISAAVRAAPGVARLGIVPRGRGGVLRDHRAGLALRTGPAGVSVDCYLVVLPGANLLETGAAVQKRVATALREQIGAEVHEVNVIIQDVGEHTPAGETVAHG
ncbi:MAG TPA: Asp23/Gls24 family envelope stress response protein [Alphaproteobacteria bacterium]|nr:Asp23/Gls24 family envelope stress response protein [Alphaproteobacteria bacterium]